jgi:hypothetical protein
MNQKRLAVKENKQAMCYIELLVCQLQQQYWKTLQQTHGTAAQGPCANGSNARSSSWSVGTA